MNDLNVTAGGDELDVTDNGSAGDARLARIPAIVIGLAGLLGVVLSTDGCSVYDLCSDSIYMANDGSGC